MGTNKAAGEKIFTRLDNHIGVNGAGSEKLLTRHHIGFNDAGGESNFARLPHNLVPEGIEVNARESILEQQINARESILEQQINARESILEQQIDARESILEQQINQSLERETLGVCVYISSRFLSSNQTNASSNRTSYCNDQNLR